ncbi:hypothetical protein O3G_MSEX007988 [Manduca sexta]|uniref:Uncharacterized protein n=2 Tax=Manduca sexta TaxID=7130 RepID=A0A921Z8R7_MANSE|nr:hypothetical protein O3G_MSEX007988 [Manduca sexta]
MQTSTVIVLACLVVVVASAHFEHSPAVEAVQEAVYDTPAHDSSPRTKRGLLLLKKKLLLGALGLKAAKVGVGAGVVGAIALKSKSGHHHHAPPTYVEIHSWH